MKVKMAMCKHSWEDAMRGQIYPHQAKKVERLCVLAGFLPPHPEIGQEDDELQPLCKECLEEAIQEIKNANSLG